MLLRGMVLYVVKACHVQAEVTSEKFLMMTLVTLIVTCYLNINSRFFCSECPQGESCYQSEIDCSKPQPVAFETPAPASTDEPITSSPSTLSSTVSSLSSVEVEINDIETDDSEENWDTESLADSNEVDNSEENWDSESTADSANIDNEGEDWGGEPSIDNEGEDWGSSGNAEVDNSGEDWSNPEPTHEPTPKMPTPIPSPEPTIDLLGRLEDLKGTMYCE